MSYNEEDFNKLEERLIQLQKEYDKLKEAYIFQCKYSDDIASSYGEAREEIRKYESMDWRDFISQALYIIDDRLNEIENRVNEIEIKID